MTASPPRSFAGLDAVLTTPDIETEQGLADHIDLREDISGERETVDKNTCRSQFRSAVGRLSEVLGQAAQSITSKTERDYRNIAKRFWTWLVEQGFVRSDDMQWGEVPCDDMPMFICGFIMDLCDSIDFRDGKTKPSSQRRSGNTTAQKIRAALTYFFGILCGLGNVEWHKDAATGRMIGNPSISSLVSRYMVGLQRRKAQAGEAPTSARAITPVRQYILYRLLISDSL